jgi:hypothetical protein
MGTENPSVKLASESLGLRLSLVRAWTFDGMTEVRGNANQPPQATYPWRKLPSGTSVPGQASARESRALVPVFINTGTYPFGSHGSPHPTTMRDLIYENRHLAQEDPIRQSGRRNQPERPSVVSTSPPRPAGYFLPCHTI